MLELIDVDVSRIGALGPIFESVTRKARCRKSCHFIVFKGFNGDIMGMVVIFMI